VVLRTAAGALRAEDIRAVWLRRLVPPTHQEAE
jgi:hypothetical protein